MLPVLWLLLAAPTPAAPDSGTTMFRGSALHTGAYPPAKGSYGGIAWRLQTGGPVRSSPVVSQGVVYVGSTDGKVYAIDAARGTTAVPTHTLVVPAQRLRQAYTSRPC